MHTPGPWIIKGQDIIGNDINGYICTWSGRSEDAFLIAAAPDLLEALTNCLWLADLLSGNTDEIGNKIIAEARQAIKKAKGET